MGNYVYWDANKHLNIAKDLGFKENPEPFEELTDGFQTLMIFTKME